ncbi:MAG: hypothetical protein K1X52_01455 [Pyrinomonadaceae bacterium]|nr:hypothetical protein [Pyrinomonadaceae bacterium]
MKLAKKAYLSTLVILTLVFAVVAQNKHQRPDSDPRNTAPTVGTGGAVGGPTGLFTVYDGQNLRKGEFTFSAAVSNYDRDPGDVDITDVPLSFQVGLTDHIELFFSTDLYKGIKVNSPRNLSGFYLPNSKVVINGQWVQAPAIVMSPGTSPYGAVYRPAGAPFVQFPYFGGNAGTYGLQPPAYSGPVFGFPAGTNALLGSGGANPFRGIGSVYGSILPGLVLSTANIIGPTGAPQGTVPSVFTLAPSYLPDAPFINRTYGESAFNQFTFGGKVRFTSVDNPIGLGLVASYTWFSDHANDFAGFNQMQRGAGPGGGWGDVAVTFVADARVAKWANLSANIGYNWTSAAKGDFPGGTYTLLDRPDEVQAGIGADFPVNKWFQPIVEFRATRYIGGRTPNAFENHPMDGIAGARVFFTRWAGMSFAYRYNFNQQDEGWFDKDKSFTASVTNPCAFVTGGGGGGGTVVGTPNCVAQTYTTNWKGTPPGFRESGDGHGYIFQFFVGRRNERAKELVNQPASINSVTLSDSVITLGCQPGYKSASGSCDDSRSISVATSASDPENDPLVYNYTVSGGRIVGSGANVTWDLAGVEKGTYTITTGVDDGCGVCGKTDTKTIEVKECADCVKICDCPSVSVSGPAGITNPGQQMTFTANVSGGANVTYNWTVSAGTISSGQGTSSITVDTTKEMANSSVTATVQIGGLDANCQCPDTASETAGISDTPHSNLVDEFGKQKDDEVKARVDNFYIQLNNDPTATGYIINYGTPAQMRHRRAQIMKAINFRKYDKNRVVFVDGGDNGQGEYTKFWVRPAGADEPKP